MELINKQPEQPDEIVIDEKTKQMILDIVKAINELQGRLKVICQTIVNCAEREGEYQLSSDMKKLVKIEKG